MSDRALSDDSPIRGRQGWLFERPPSERECDAMKRERRLGKGLAALVRLQGSDGDPAGNHQLDHESAPETFGGGGSVLMLLSTPEDIEAARAAPAAAAVIAPNAPIAAGAAPAVPTHPLPDPEPAVVAVAVVVPVESPPEPPPPAAHAVFVDDPIVFDDPVLVAPPAVAPLSVRPPEPSPEPVVAPEPAHPETRAPEPVFIDDPIVFDGPILIDDEIFGSYLPDVELE